MAQLKGEMARLKKGDTQLKMMAVAQQKTHHISKLPSSEEESAKITASDTELDDGFA